MVELTAEQRAVLRELINREAKVLAQKMIAPGEPTPAVYMARLDLLGSIRHELDRL